jgi:ribosomal protein S18 acetylase RimI-like enzyme
MSGDVVVRRGTSSDAAAVAGLNAVVQQLHHDEAPHLFRAPDAAGALGYFQEALARDGVLVILAAEVGSAEPCGYLYADEFVRPPDAFCHARHGLYVHHLAVAPAHRRRGIARQLVLAAEDEARARGLSVVRLDTGAFNEPAQRAFAAMGYEAYNIRLERTLT